MAINSKEMRWSFDMASDQSNLNIVTAFAHGIGSSLGVIKSGKSGSEILSLYKLVTLLDVRGITITADALHCQRKTYELIVQESGDYCL